MNFKSYFWNESQIEDEQIKSALGILSSTVTSDGEKTEAFDILLSDPSPIAQGIAFDQYFYKNSQTRFGTENLFEPFEEMLLKKARSQLQTAPFVGKTSSGDSINGANYASSLNILALLGDESDIPAITKILIETDDASVVWSGCMAASTCLRNSKTVYPKLFDVLEAVTKSETFPDATKTEAVDALCESLTDETERTLEQVVNAADFPVNVYAAICLGNRNISKHRKLLENLVARLPDDAPYPASDLIDLLEEAE